MTDNSPEQPLFDLFEKHQIQYQRHHHKPVFTVGESDEVNASIPGAHSKNLFLRDKHKNYFLISVRDHKRVDLKELAKQLDVNKFSFGSEEALNEKLGVRPGSVTAFAMIYGSLNDVNFYLDKDFLLAESVNFHPLRNDMTVNISTAEFIKFLNIMQISYKTIDIPLLATHIESMSSCA